MSPSEAPVRTVYEGQIGTFAYWLGLDGIWPTSTELSTVGLPPVHLEAVYDFNVPVKEITLIAQYAYGGAETKLHLPFVLR